MPRSSFIIGADLSMLKQIMDHGGKYQWNQEGDPIGIFSAAGFSHARLRLFNNPTRVGAQVNDLDYTIELAQRLKAAGFGLLLDFHYSDGWADPGKQRIPWAWRNLGFDALVAAVHHYTRDVIEAMRRHDVLPEMVQIGNEITPGMLWEHGRITRQHGPDSLHWELDGEALSDSRWQRFCTLLKAGISGVKAVAGASSINIMLHIDRGGDQPTCDWFFRNIERQHVPYDSIGLSYYPFWHGTPEDLRATLHFLAAHYGKGLYLVETAYPYRDHPLYHEAMRNHPELWQHITSRFPLTPAGQRDFLKHVLGVMTELPGDLDRGLFYWAPEWIPTLGERDEADASACWTRALFDADGRALPALDALAEFKEATAAL